MIWCAGMTRETGKAVEASGDWCACHHQCGSSMWYVSTSKFCLWVFCLCLLCHVHVCLLLFMCISVHLFQIFQPQKHLLLHLIPCHPRNLRSPNLKPAMSRVHGDKWPMDVAAWYRLNKSWCFLVVNLKELCIWRVAMHMILLDWDNSSSNFF